MSICEYLSRFFFPKKKKKTSPKRMVHGLNKTDNIRKHLIKFHSINNRDAFELYDVINLSSIIYRLKKQGMDIDAYKSKTASKHGKNLITITSYVY